MAAEFAIKQGLVGEPGPAAGKNGRPTGLHLTQEDVEAIKQIRDVISSELENEGLMSARSTDGSRTPGSPR